ncbi:ATP-binding protein [Dyadobacter sp. CY326]|uniref:ATP-binding protein n=1 Tax=Dyadobacter sp. CY326 TaxID=2907300 RepID=UPI001F32AA78|nr:ATP-binding protein [Dyadobacter sp. CY326]MCE7066065.1 ATP-binding protein [Dyadobacter sp. CY326]
MDRDLDSVKVVFKCQREEIPGTVGICLNQIKEKTEGRSIDEAVLSRIKWAIAELLTNAVKHSGEPESALTIKIGADELVLEKEDSGKPLVLIALDKTQIAWPLENPLSVDFAIYHNGMDSLYVRTHQSGKAIFFVEELPEVLMPLLLSDTSEHFGLLIMTKAADEFTYEYDPLKKINRFMCLFNLKTN